MGDKNQNTIKGERVGPVLKTGATADAIVAAIRQLNPDAEILDRGAYVRVLVPGRCVLTRAAVEKNLGTVFRLPTELERVMPSFKGKFFLSEDEAVWAFEERS